MPTDAPLTAAELAAIAARQQHAVAHTDLLTTVAIVHQDVPRLLADVERLAPLTDALAYAIQVIESYELDIREANRTSPALARRGFCQGELYREAVADIVWRAEGRPALRDRHEAPAVTRTRLRQVLGTAAS